MHYVAERHDKDQHLDLLQFIVQANPQSKALEDAALFAADIDPTTATQGGWRGAIRSMWGGSSSTGAKAPAAAASAGKAATTVPGQTTAAHNRRKSVRPVRGSIHEQYNRK
jgi:hypothetical protein